MALSLVSWLAWDPPEYSLLGSGTLSPQGSREVAEVQTEGLY